MNRPQHFCFSHMRFDPFWSVSFAEAIVLLFLFLKRFLQQIFACDVFFFLLDGRVPDEGACVELGLAYCQKELQNRKKLLIGLQTDRRAAFLGSNLNPMILVPLDYIAPDEEILVHVLQQYRATGTLILPDQS